MSRIVQDQTACLITPMELPQVTAAGAPGVSPFVAPAVTPSGAQAGTAPTQQPSAEALAAAKQKGYDEGLARGRKEGQEAAARNHDAQLVSLRGAVQQLVGYRSKIRTEVEREVVDLAFAVARRILRREVTLDPTAAAGIVRSCLDERSGAEISRILVHPDDLAQVKLCVGDSIEVSASSNVARGGALLATERGMLDARIDSQIDELQTGLADA